MARRIAVDLNPSNSLDVDGALVARGLGLELDEFKRLMEHRKITVLCERGVREDAGLYRASFYYAGKRTRLVIDGKGRQVSAE